MNLNLNKGFNETAIITSHKLIAKVGSFYYYKADFQVKRGVNVILRYPIKKNLRKLKRINDMTFYGRVK